ncbi:MAG: hypothetical protein HKP58_15775 [Desulfatitalea sp.]|nr:hypothetical protein [Desulfatitalea sp.]NNK01870.1 hypothetical protein [Desulfatitalea sp.]
MDGIFAHSRKLPPLSEFQLKSYAVNFSLDRLVPGVDNIRHDVLISPTFAIANRKIVGQLLTRHARLERRGKQDHQVGWNKEVESYKQMFCEVMRDALNHAKARREPQIENLAQAAMIKMLLEEIGSQFDHLVGRLKRTVRKSDLAVHNDLEEAHKLKDRLQLIMQEREVITKRVGQEICGFWDEVERNDIRIMREAVFGNRSTFFSDVMATSILHVQDSDNEHFVLAEYDVAMGRRIEDPDKYDNLLFFLRWLINQIDLVDPSVAPMPIDQRLAVTLSDNQDAENSQKAYVRKIDGWLSFPGNMDILLNWQRTKSDLLSLKKRKGSAEEIARLKRMISHQKAVLHFIYKAMIKRGVIDRIAASYEMQPEYLEYCPPLVPQQVIQYLILPKARRVIKSRLRRLSKVYGRSFQLASLNKKVKFMEQITTAKRKAHLIRFMNAFSRYHRDISNMEILKEAMERVHLATEEKVATLSRENNTLYEFLLPHEKEVAKTPIINHVVIKADVRGSTDITHRMNDRGLNPASYFSLNFFDPISEILSEYGASKIFIEGDAIILAIFERENTPVDWYAVARACGIAINMLVIIQRYNEKSRKHQLPILELGIGISYLDKAPTFLFDGSNRIMISSAINHADRLSSCSKKGRRLVAQKKSPFRLHVFQTRTDEEMATTADDLFMRVNVNGIELNAAGFDKLSKEIDLRMVPSDFKDIHDRKTTLYVGKFPTKSGKYQRLVIRESLIPVVEPQNLNTLRISSRNYYEVCTNPKLYQWVRQNERLKATA